MPATREAARRTVLYVAVFPFAYFFTQVYTESLFLLVSVSAVAAAVAARWGWAGLLGGLAALVRPNGVLIAVPLGLLALAGRPRPAELAGRAARPLAVPLGLAALLRLLATASRAIRSAGCTRRASGATPSATGRGSS